jgi:hypothetical protein
MLGCKELTVASWGKLFAYGKGANVFPLASLLGAGNTKLPSTTAVFNMSSANDCISKKMGLCKATEQGYVCYAMKAEYSYRPQVLPYRRRQGEFWKGVSAKDFVAQFLFINASKPVPFKNIRFNEAGDFHNQGEVDKAEEIALHLRRFGIRCYCYTSRSDLNFSKVRHLIISGSNFTKKGISNRFRIVRDVKKERMKGEGVCRGDCRICRLCLMKNMKVVIKNH